MSLTPNNYVFKRIETKYLLTKWQYELIQEELSSYTVEDEYGLSTIRNIYYDTDDYLLARRSIDKPIYKEKFRIRTYGTPDSEDYPIYLEIKKKYDGIVYKRRTKMRYADALNYLNNGIKPDLEDSQILNEIDYFLSFHNPEPKMYIAYDRIATYVIENPTIRITFDFNIRSRMDHLNLQYGDEGTHSLWDNGLTLMEIKAPGAYPLWLSEILSKLKIYPTGFSKYGYFYKEHLANTGNEASAIEMSNLLDIPLRPHLTERGKSCSLT